MTFDSTRPILGFTQRGKFGGAALVAAAMFLSPTLASAEPMDFALERLAENASACRTAEGYALPGVVCQPDEDAFFGLVNQFGMALAPTSMYPARTTGYGGFEIAYEGAFTFVNGDADYMKSGTRGKVDTVVGDAETSNPNPSSLLHLQSLRIRKGFGFGFETGVQFGFLPGTSIISGGADLRLALLEGFRDNVPGYLPDLAATGSVRTITGTPQVQLTVVGVSGIASKPITIADSAVLTPSVGYQHLFIFGDSGVIDFTPAESALQACGYQGPDIPGTEGAEDNDGSPVCGDGDNLVDDFNNNKVFDPVRIQRGRLIFGLNYRYEVFTIGGQFMADIIDPAKLNPGDEERFDDEPANHAFAIQVGGQF